MCRLIAINQMKRVVFKTIETAVTNCGEAIEAGDHFKNGASPKSQMSRGNIFMKACFAFLAMGLFFSSCKKDEDKLPAIETTSASNIGVSIATLGGSIIDENAADYRERGVVYATSEKPTIGNSKKTVSGKEVGSFSTTVTGLSANTTYYVRAYAIYDKGTAYGDEISFKTIASYTGHIILGKWSYYNSVGNWSYFLTFNANGTGSFASTSDSNAHATFGWAINGQDLKIGIISGSLLVGLVLPSEFTYDSSTDRIQSTLYTYTRAD